MKIGDKIEFQVGEETFQDKITYIDSGIVEGEKFDLTMIITSGEFLIIE